MCAIEGCEKPPVGRGWCRTHYMRWRRHGDPVAETRPYSPQRGPCSQEGCDRPCKAKGLCDRHYQKWTRGTLHLPDQPAPMTECSMDGCTRRHKAAGLCSLHYNRLRRTGDVGGVDDAQVKVPRPDQCTFEDCGRPVLARELCGGHYKQQLDGRPMGPLVERAPHGAGWTNKDGYRCFKRAGRTWFEHRWNAEQALGRPILDTEEIHHVNGNRADNRTDGPFQLDDAGRLRSGNLELWSTSQPKGQEIGPKVEWAVELLRLYAPHLLADGQTP